MLLEDEQLRDAFKKTNTSEPLSEGWPGLERFAREIERLVIEEAQNRLSRYHDVDEFYPE